MSSCPCPSVQTSGSGGTAGPPGPPGGVTSGADTDTIEMLVAGPSVSANAFTQMSITSDASGLMLDGDETAPGNDQLYGTNGSGVKGWYPQPAGGSVTVADTDTVDLTLTGPQIEADVRLQMSVTSDVSGVKLSGDEASPGNSQLYGTDSSGVKGWYDQPSGTVTVADTDTIDLTLTGPVLESDVRAQMSITSDAGGLKLSGDATTPGNSKYYGTDGTGTKGYYDLPAAGGGGGGGAGGMDDRTAETAEAGVTVAWRILDETVNGLVHTYGYDAFDRIVLDETLSAGTARAIAYDPTTGFGTASGNIYVNGGKIKVTKAEATANKAALTALGSAVDGVEFWVSDLEDDETSGAAVAWAPNDAKYNALVVRPPANPWRLATRSGVAKSRGTTSTIGPNSGVAADTAAVDSSTLGIAGGQNFATIFGTLPATRYTAAAAATNRAAGFTDTYYRSGMSVAPNTGGFDQVLTWSKTYTGSGAKIIVGLVGTLAAVGVSYYTSSNFIAVVAEGGTDTNLQMCCRAAGAVTKVDLGANFPPYTSGTDFYALYLRHVGVGATMRVYWTVIRLNTGNIAQGVFVSGTDNLPASAQQMAPYAVINSGTDAIAAVMDTMGHVQDEGAAEYWRKLLVATI